MGNCKLRLFLCLASLVFSSANSYASSVKMPELRTPKESALEQTVFICGVHGECPNFETTDSDAARCASNGGTWITNTGVLHCRHESDLEGDRCGANAHWHEKKAMTDPDGNGCMCDDGYEFGATGCLIIGENTGNEDCDSEFDADCDDTPPVAGDDTSPPSRTDCRANFAGQEHQEYCINQYKNVYFAQDKAAAERRLISRCQEQVQSAINVCEDTSSLDSLPPAAVVTPGTTPEVACQIVETNRSNMAAFNSHASSCTNAGASCQSSCESLRELVYDEPIPLPTSISSSCSTETAPIAAQSSSQASAFSSPIAGAQTTCSQLTANNDAGLESEASAPDPSSLTSTTPPTTSATDPATDPGENELGSSDGGNNNELYGALGTAAIGLAADNFSADNFESDFDASAFKGSSTAINSNFAGTSSSRNLARNTDSSASFNPGARAKAGDYGDLIDDPRYNQSPNAPGSLANNNPQQNGRTGGRAGSTTNPQAARLSASSGNTPSNRKRAGRGRSSLSTRNLVNGYRTVRASDGGGSLSIRPKDLKKYGKKTLKAKLNAARKAYGKKIPLMFKNGKFVRDFLAMKEAKGFKSRQAAMEGYWRGETSTHSSHRPLTLLEMCTQEQDCHQNENENIFNLMHLKVQKTLIKYISR